MCLRERGRKMGFGLPLEILRVHCLTPRVGPRCPDLKRGRQGGSVPIHLTLRSQNWEVRIAKPWANQRNSLQLAS